MFETYYKLSDNPFRLTPDPKFCSRHPGHNRAYAYLQYALRLGEGFIMVTGEPGIGKTTLARVFLAELNFSEVVAAQVASVNMGAENLLRVVAYAYGIDVEGLDKVTILIRLKQFFVKQVKSGKRVLLIVDEAQELPYSALEELRLLADLQVGSLPLLQLFLIGRENLCDLMQDPAMEQFQQRVIGVCCLEPLSLTDTREYIEHRLRKADWKGDPELTGGALLAVYEFSKGVPRHINKICTRLLLDGFVGQKHKLSRKDVLDVAEELREERLAPLGGIRAVASDMKYTGLVPELENGTLTIADLALRADPEQPPLPASPVTPEAVARVEERTDSPYTKQVTANIGGRRERSQHPDWVILPTWRSNCSAEFDRWVGYFDRAVRRVKECATEGARQLGIPGLGAKLLQYRDEVERKFENHPWLDGWSGMRVGAVATVALALTLLLPFSEKEVGSHSVVVEVYRKATSETMATDMAELLSVNLGSFEYKSVGPGVEEHTQYGGSVVSALPQNPVLSLSEFHRGSVEPDDTEVSHADEMAAATRIAPAPAAAIPPSVNVASSQAIAHAADVVIQLPEPVVEQENTATTERASVTDRKVEVEVAAVEISRVARPVSLEDRIIELLSLAQRALRSDRLLIPDDNNAYQYYQQVLELEPGNKSALFGMDQIVERYVSLGREALERQDSENVERFINRGSRVLPGDRRLAALQESLDVHEEPEPVIQLEAQQPVAETEPTEIKTPLPWDKRIFSKAQTTRQEDDVLDEDSLY